MTTGTHPDRAPAGWGTHHTIGGDATMAVEIGYWLIEYRLARLWLGRALVTFGRFVEGAAGTRSGPNRASALLLDRPGALDEASERHERASEPQPRRRAARLHRGQPLALRFRAEPRQPVFDQPVSDLDSHRCVPSYRVVCAPAGRRAVGM